MVNSLPAAPDLDPQAMQVRLAQAQHDARDVYADNTVETYGHGIRRFVRWCDDTGREYRVPVEPRDLAQFVDDVSDELAPATVGVYVSAISRMHGDLDLPSPASARVVQLALKRMRRTAAQAAGRDRSARKGRGQAKPLTREAIDAALSMITESLADLRDAALLSIAYDSMARASELIALRVSDIHRDADGSGSVEIVRSKTDQEGEGLDRYLAPDTMRRVTAWIDAARLDPDSFLFFSLSPVEPKDGPADHISRRDVSRIYQRRLGPGYSAHSTRVGAAVDQLAAGLTTGEIAQSGGWKGEAMVNRYTRRGQVKKSGAAKLAQMQGRA